MHCRAINCNAICTEIVAVLNRLSLCCSVSSYIYSYVSGVDLEFLGEETKPNSGSLCIL